MGCPLRGSHRAAGRSSAPDAPGCRLLPSGTGAPGGGVPRPPGAAVTLVCREWAGRRCECPTEGDARIARLSTRPRGAALHGEFETRHPLHGSLLERKPVAYGSRVDGGSLGGGPSCPPNRPEQLTWHSAAREPAQSIEPQSRSVNATFLDRTHGHLPPTDEPADGGSRPFRRPRPRDQGRAGGTASRVMVASAVAIGGVARVRVPSPAPPIASPSGRQRRSQPTSRHPGGAFLPHVDRC